MPNQRARSKIFLGGFIEKQFQKEIRRAARRAGMGNNVFGFAIGIIQEPLNRRLLRLKTKA